MPAAPYNFPPPRRYYGCNKQRPSRLKEASVLVKGVSRRVIVVDSPDPRIFEQAIFILPTDGGGVSSRQLVDEAVRIARSYARGQTGVRRPVASACMAVGGMGRVCLRPGVAAGCAALIVAVPWPADAVSAYYQRFPLFLPFLSRRL